MVITLLSILAAIIAYWFVLGRLVSRLKAETPELFAAVGGWHAGDFLLLGFGTGDGLVSKLERHREELREKRDIAMLLRWVRIAWGAQLVAIVIAIFVVVST
jgi:hypothetical protein